MGQGIPIVARNLRRLRKMRGLTHEQLASRVGVATTRMLETGKHGARVDTLLSITKVLGVSIGELFEDDAAPMPEELEKFLASPAAVDVTEREVYELRRVHAVGMRPTATTYYLALQTLRSMQPDKEDA